ncbi:MAG: D-aminoacyl-tRNA deacylase, partial [Candidatus Odinarchaeia archaeon]
NWLTNVEYIICPSKHSSKSGIPVLTTHTPGNFDSADFGGKPQKVSISNPFGMKYALKKLFEMKEKLGLEYRVSYEVTHHGPTLMTPICFVEVGSTSEQWHDHKATFAAAKAIISSIKEYNLHEEIAIGLGGGHYAPSFTKIGLNTDLFLGHIIPKYKADTLRRNVFEETVSNNLGVCKYLIVDWKGVPGSPRNKIIQWAKELGLEILKTSQIN